MLRSCWWDRLLPFHYHRLLAAQDGTGSAGGGQGQIWGVPALADHVPAAAGCGPGILVDGGSHQEAVDFCWPDLHFMTTITPVLGP